jgi:heme/copper-type cytochrome/quinol oxidase subunit 2
MDQLASLFMPKSAEMLLAFGVVLVFLIFFAVVWRERATDERDQLHRLIAGRVSFLVATAFLTTGIVIQAFHHNIDPWLIYTLVGMILAKLGSRIYSQLKS